MTFQWLALLAALFLMPGAIALGVMGLAMAAGATDVATRGWRQGLRRAAIFATTGATAVAWSTAIMGTASVMPTRAPTLALMIAAIIAVGPSVQLAIDMARQRDVGRDMVLALALAASCNAGIITAGLIASLRT